MIKENKTLDMLKVKESGIIISVGGEVALRRRLLDMGLTPGTKVMVRKVAPLGDPIEIFLRSFELTIRKEDAKKIIICDSLENYHNIIKGKGENKCQEPSL